jgi:hypothetical protein
LLHQISALKAHQWLNVKAQCYNAAAFFAGVFHVYHY